MENVCFLAIHSGHQVRWTYQPGSHSGGRSHRISHPPSFCGVNGEYVVRSFLPDDDVFLPCDNRLDFLHQLYVRIQSIKKKSTKIRFDIINFPSDLEARKLYVCSYFFINNN